MKWLRGLVVLLLLASAACVAWAHSSENMTISSEAEEALKGERDFQGDRKAVNLACDSLPALSLGDRANIVCDTATNTLKVSINGGAYSALGGGTGILELNGLTADPQFFAVGSSGTTPTIVSASDTHTFNFPLAGLSVTSGMISNAGQTIGGDKNFSNFISNTVTLDTLSGVGSDIAPTTNIVAVSNISAGPLTLTSTPTITAPTNGGTFIVLMNDGVDNFTLQDDGTLPGSTLQLLTGTTLTLVPKQAVLFYWDDADSLWKQVSGTASDLGCTDCVALGTETTGNYVSSATASGGLTLTGTEGGSLGIQNCTVGEIVKSTGASTWGCAADDTGSGGIASLNGLTGSTQTFTEGTSGTDFNISSVGTDHTFNIPDASGSARGVVTTGTQTLAGAKTWSNDQIYNGYRAAVTQLATLASSAASITPTANQIQISNTSGGPLTLASTPTIADPPNPSSSSWIILINTSAQPVTFQDDTNLASSNLDFRDNADRTLNAGDSMILFYSATTGLWQDAVTVLPVATDAQAGMVSTSSQTFGGDKEVSGMLGSVQDTETLIAASDRIDPLTSYHVVNNTSGGPLTMTSTPTIAAPLSAGEYMLYLSNSSANSVTIQDENNLAGSNVELVGNVNIQLNQYEGIWLWWDDTNNIWREVGAGFTAIPDSCAANQFVTAQNTRGALTCSQPDHGNLAGLTDDDHTQYALLAGRSGGQTLIGGTGASENLTLRSTSNATAGTIDLYGETRGLTGITAISSSKRVFRTRDQTYTLTNSGTNVTAFTLAGTYEMANSFNHQISGVVSTAKLTSTASPTVGASVASFLFRNLTEYNAANAAITLSENRLVGFYDTPSFTVTGTGTWSGASTGYDSFRSGVGLTGAGVTIGGGIDGFHAGGVSVASSATCALQRGVHIDDLTACTTNIGLDNDSTTVYVPDAAQTISAAGNTVTVTDTTFKLVSNTTAGSITLTSTPTIADGSAGQYVIILNTGTQDIVFQDQGTLASSNLRLPGTGVTLGPRDTLTLIYSAAIGDWVAVATSNNT